MPTLGELLDEAERRLIASDAVEHPHRGKERSDVEELLGSLFGFPDVWDLDAPVAPGVARRFASLLDRRASGEPPAYITGSTEFFGLRLTVRPGTFIPRQSSEWMAAQAIRRLRRRRDPVHVDMATGIGPVALATGSEVPGARVIGVDISPSAIQLARANARRLRLSNVRFLRGDLFGPLPGSLRGSVDVLSIHPPYVGTRELRNLPREIVAFEPRESLTDGSPLGDRIVTTVAEEAPGWLRQGGWLLVEVSPDVSRWVGTVLRRSGFREVRSTIGGARVGRVVVGRS